MTVEILGLDVGSWADWAAAIGGLASAGFGIAALRLAQQANHHAQQANELSERTAEESRRQGELANTREEQREQRTMASAVQAWWAVRTADEQWGVLITNQGGTASMVNDMEVAVSGGKAGPKIKVPALPPGRYFVASEYEKWAYPEPVDGVEQFQPITRDGRYAVHQICFTDTLGQRWSWSPRKGLEQQASVVK